MKYFILAARLLIGIIFVYASIYKILDPESFALSIRNYMLVPPSWSNLVGMTLPWVELGGGVFLILGIQTKPSALLTTAMLAVFLGAMIYAYSIGLDIDCGCFSSAANSSGKIGTYQLGRDTLLLLVSLFILVKDRGDLSLSNVFNKRLRLLNA